MEATITLVYFDEKIHTHRYKEVDELTGEFKKWGHSFYLMKTLLGSEEAPRTIKLTVQG